MENEYEFDIVEVNEIDGGVEVFARVFRDGAQLGFGRDGTVDIERFRIFNPPVLVDDPNGDIVREWQEEDLMTGEMVIKTRTLREDPAQAVLESLSHTVSIMKNVHDSSRIVEGKRGNTTSTFYPGSGDGGILGYQTESTPSQALWDELHDSTTLTGAVTGIVSHTESAITDTYAVRTVYRSGTNSTQIGRSFFPIDTSGLPDGDTIDSAVFSIYGNAYLGTSLTMGIVQTAQADTSSLSLTDFDTCGDAINNPTEGAARVAVSDTTPSYRDWTLNVTGISWISKTGFTKLGLRSSNDMDDTLPTSGDDKRFNMAYSDYTGTSQDPKLVVEHSAATSTQGLMAWF